jgi:hypothetical protein
MALREFYPTSAYTEHRYRECVQCGMSEYLATLDFLGGSVAPTIGETLTGATSADTGVVLEVSLWSGTYAGGDAAGRILLETITGWDRLQYSIFDEAELVTGSTGGAGMMTVDNGTVKVNSRLSPEGETAVVDGVRYCRFHYDLRFPKKYLAEAVLDLDERERTNPDT